LFLGTALLRRSKDEEAFAVFQTELDHCEKPSHRRKILYQMGTEYRKLKKWNQSIECLEKICLAEQDSTKITQSVVNEAIAQTYLEQYCTDATLDIKQ